MDSEVRRCAQCKEPAVGMVIEGKESNDHRCQTDIIMGLVRAGLPQRRCGDRGNHHRYPVID